MNDISRIERGTDGLIARVAAACLCWCVLFAADASVGEESAVPAGRSGASNTVLITAGQLTYDYEAKRGVFEKNVRVLDGDATIDADRMTVVFLADNSAKTITATGNVRMMQEGRVVTCSTAVCEVAEGDVVLLGNVEVRSGGDIIRGDTVRINRETGRMTCQPGYFRRAAGAPGFGILRISK